MRVNVVEIIQSKTEIKFNIPNDSLGKQVWIWIWVKGLDMNVIFSGMSSPIHTRRGYGGFGVININNYEFTQKRGLLTKNIYDNSSEVYQKIKEFERTQGTVV